MHSHAYASVVQRHGIPAQFARPCETLDSCAICLSLASLHKIALQSSCAFTASVLKVAVNHATSLRPLFGKV